MRQLASSGAALWISFTFVTALTFFARFLFLGLVLSALSIAACVCVMQSVYMSVQRRREFLPRVFTALMFTPDSQ
jgi:hypothetical protein